MKSIWSFYWPESSLDPHSSNFVDPDPDAINPDSRHCIHTCIHTYMKDRTNNSHQREISSPLRPGRSCQHWQSRTASLWSGKSSSPRPEGILNKDAGPCPASKVIYFFFVIWMYFHLGLIQNTLRFYLVAFTTFSLCANFEN